MKATGYEFVPNQSQRLESSIKRERERLKHNEKYFQRAADSPAALLQSNGWGVCRNSRWDYLNSNRATKMLGASSTIATCNCWSALAPRRVISPAARPSSSQPIWWWFHRLVSTTFDEHPRGWPESRSTSPRLASWPGVRTFTFMRFPLWWFKCRQTSE